jgi:membrane fusion protein (multidrug efflux system)
MKISVSSMTRRMLVMLAAMGVVVTSLGAFKYHQIRTMVAMAASFQPPPEAVTTLVARSEEWPTSLRAIGTVAAVQGVSVSADLPGVVSEIAFQSGTRVEAGALLVRLDTSEEQAQLESAQAQRELSRLSLERMNDLVAQGIVPQADHDRASAEFKQADARIAEIRATIRRKTIRAPFSGVLGIRQANRGQYLNAGAPVVSLQSLDPIYVNFAVPQQQVSLLSLGGEVRVTAEGIDGERLGKITAKDSIVDTGTRNVQVQATFPNAEGKLRPGMFVEPRVDLGRAGSAVTLPATSVNYAPYGDSIFVVEQMKTPRGETYRGVRQQFVKLGPARGDQVSIVAGVKDGEEVVSSGVFKLRNGVAVSVNNSVQPTNNPAPALEDK